MPISDREVWTAANLIVKRHGANAAIESARMLDRMLDLGDPEGQLVWQWIKRAIDALQAPATGHHTEPRGSGSSVGHYRQRPASDGNRRLTGTLGITPTCVWHDKRHASGRCQRDNRKERGICARIERAAYQRINPDAASGGRGRPDQSPQHSEKGLGHLPWIMPNEEQDARARAPAVKHGIEFVQNADDFKSRLVTEE
jgi:hypothetical protein